MNTQNEIANVINGIIKERGVEIIKEPKILCSMLDDLAPQAYMERNAIRRVLIYNQEICNKIHCIYCNEQFSDEIVINKLEYEMVNNYGVSKQWVKIIFSAFGINYQVQNNYSVNINTKEQLSHINTKNNISKPFFEKNYFENMICGDRNYVFGISQNNKVTVCESRRDDYSASFVKTIRKWSNIIAIYKSLNAEKGFMIIGLKSNGDVVVADMIKNNEKALCVKWHDIKNISAGYSHIVGMKRDGTVVACGDNRFGQCNVSSWSNIKYVQAYHTWTLGVKNDGSVIYTGDERFLNDFTDIEKVDDYYVIGIKKNKTLVVADKFDSWRDIDPTEWLLSLQNVKKIRTNYAMIVILFEDGTVKCNQYEKGVINTTDTWYDVIDIATDGNYIVGISRDGTVVAATAEKIMPKSMDINDAVSVVYGSVGCFLIIHKNGRISAYNPRGEKFDIWMNEMRNWRICIDHTEESKYNIPYKYDNGEYYIGEWKNGKINGKGTIYWSTGEKLSGEFKNGNAFNCEGTLIYKSGKYVGAIVEGLRTGYGKCYHNNGDYCEGEYHNGKLNGQGMYRWKDGSTWQGEFKDNQPWNGNGTWHYEDGTIKTGKWKNGRKKLFS